MCPACLQVAGGTRAERWKFSTLTIGCHKDSRPLMTFSSMPDAARTRYLLDLLAQLPDPRKRRGRVMASLRSLAISILRLDGHTNIAAANRHHARDPQRTLKLLQA